MADFDLVVIGGGPAGYAAALKAAERSAAVALIEAERPGGSCVHHACIPTNIMLDAAADYVRAREMAVMGVFEAGEAFNFARAAARKDALVAKMAEGIAAALRMRKVTVLQGRAEFSGSHLVSVAGTDGATSELTAEAFVIATGTRWEPPAIPGVAPERVLTPDAVQSLVSVPSSAVVLGDSPADTGFALEYAVLLATAGTAVTIATSRQRLLPGLDIALADAVRGSLGDIGVRVVEGVAVAGEGGVAVRLTSETSTESVPAEVLVAVDVRRPFFEGINLTAAGVTATGAIPVDRDCRTNVPSIFAAGDVTGGPMLSSAATHMGEVAAINATGGEAVARLSRIPHLLHTITEIGWIGLTEEAARARGYDVATGAFDLSFNARAIALGARAGIVKVVADRELGEILGVHVVGPEASEIMAVAAASMQAEVTLDDLAAMVHWHPGAAEGLAAAARRAL
jgi:dihydrolipoamide dehydrogenase